MTESDLPRLEARDLEEIVRRCLEVDRAHHLFAVFGTGDCQMLKVSQAPDLEVIPVRSELELRSLLPPLEKRRSVGSLPCPVDRTSAARLGGPVCSTWPRDSCGY
ncbi:MAG: hypothetical protein IPK82_21095 [Polyangiaceae bacterium]|nr:hypothetical protein [Polyangiaceae bacterium]